MTSSIKAFWWRQVRITGIRPNFGDEITAAITPSIAGVKCSWALPHRSEMVGAGSTLEMVQRLKARRGLKVWGSGFMASEEVFDRNFSNPDFDFYAVRGKLTLERIRPTREVALGDPGLLVSRVYPRSAVVPGRVGLVYHYVHKQDPVVLKLAREGSVLLIDPMRDPAEVVADITTCEFVFSTSLHGLITADAFGIPNAWIALQNGIGGGGYKYEDYYSVFDGKAVQYQSKLVWDKDAIAQLTDDYRPIPNLSDIQDGLVAAFPRPARTIP